jgi:cytochrome c biogenesis protein ResB
MVSRVFKTLSSLRFTLALILSLSVLFLLGLWIPQKSLLKRELYLQWKDGSPALVRVLDSISLTDIYTSPVMLLLWSLFFLNLILVMIKTVPAVAKRIARPGTDVPIPEMSAFRYGQTIRVPQQFTLESLGPALSRSRYRFYPGPRSFVAVKNRLSPLATILFHTSFFLVLLGGLATIYTRFSGTIDLAEGEVFRGASAQYNPVPRLPKMGGIPNAEFLVERIDPTVEQNTPTGLRVTLLDRSGARHAAEINRPYKDDETSYVIQDLGVAPLFVLYDKKGRELDGAYVKLDVLKGKQDAFFLSGLKFTAAFFSDHAVIEGVDTSRSEELRNPVFRLHIEKNGRFAGMSTIRPGQTVAFGEYRLALKEMRYWVRLYIIKEHGLGILYAGFAVAVIALIWRLYFYRREIVGAVHEDQQGRTLQVAGKAEFYPALFEDEFQEVIQRISSLVSSERPATPDRGR